jgi:hypothetical protein
MTIAAEWTSLEIVKLVVAASTPLLVFALGIIVTRAARRLEDAQWASRKLIERRLELYDEMAPLLNDLLCFLTLRGHFRDISPREALDTKRRADQLFFVGRHLMEDDFGEYYLTFIDACFKHYVGTGRDALLRASVEQQRLERGAVAWDDAWTDMYVADPADVMHPLDVVAAYDALMRSFSDQLGVRPRRSAAG